MRLHLVVASIKWFVGPFLVSILYILWSLLSMKLCLHPSNHAARISPSSPPMQPTPITSSHPRPIRPPIPMHYCDVMTWSHPVDNTRPSLCPCRLLTSLCYLVPSASLSTTSLTSPSPSLTSTSNHIDILLSNLHHLFGARCPLLRPTFLYLFSYPFPLISKRGFFLKKIKGESFLKEVIVLVI